MGDIIHNGETRVPGVGSPVLAWRLSFSYNRGVSPPSLANGFLDTELVLDTEHLLLFQGDAAMEVHTH